MAKKVSAVARKAAKRLGKIKGKTRGLTKKTKAMHKAAKPPKDRVAKAQYETESPAERVKRVRRAGKKA